jgi:hypothetical protein
MGNLDRDMHNESQDFSIALTLEHGRLFTDAFDLPSPAAHTTTPVPLPAVQSVSINAKAGRVPLTETREGIARTEPREGDTSTAKEGPTQCLHHCIACSAVPSAQYSSGDQSHASAQGCVKVEQRC